MLVDLNLSNGHRRPQWTEKVPLDRQLDFATFALTPGIPAELVNWWIQLRRGYVTRMFNLVDSLRDQAEPLAIDNAASVTEEDGWAMLLRLRKRGYAGVIPHWSSLALERRAREQGWKTIQDQLGVTHMYLIRHRKSSFHPLTFNRLVARRGTPGVAIEYQVTR